MKAPWAAVIVVVACAESSDAPPGDVVETSTDARTEGDIFAADAAPSACDEVPTLRWANFASGFLIQNCQPCHASTALERHGAPVGVTFDTLDEALGWSSRVRARSVDALTMPPAGGISVSDRALLEAWLDCGEPGGLAPASPE